MKILYILHSERTATLDAMVASQTRSYELLFYDLRTEDDFHRLVTLIEECDRVFSW